MIDQNYDNIISLIVNSDNKNKDRILGFINSFPKGLLEQLNNDLGLIRDGCDITNIGNQYETDDKRLYWYLINSSINEMIDIGFSIYDNNKYKKVFEMTLIYYSDKKLLIDENVWLGKIEYNINEYQMENKTYVESIEQEYQLVKNKLGNFILNYKNGSLSSINRVKFDKNKKLVRNKM